MSHRIPLFHARPALATLVALAAFAGGAHAQAEDWQSVATACTPATLPSLQNAQFNTAGGFIRAPAGAGGPQLVYTCNVLDSFAAIVPNWNVMQLQALDNVGGAVTAALYAKNKVTGASALVAVVPSVAAGVVANATVAIPALNFAANSYHIVLTLTPQANSRPQAHMVKLLF